MPYNTPLVKKAAVVDFGAEIVMADNTPEAREAKADEVLAETGGGECVCSFSLVGKWARSVQVSLTLAA